MPLHQRAAQRTQRLRVRTPPTFARQILVPRLEQFTRSQPDIELEVVLSIPFLDVASSDADVEVRNGDAAAAGGDVLMRDVVMPMASPALLARLPPLLAPADLAHAPLLRTPLEPWTPDAGWTSEAGEEFATLSEAARCDLIFAVADLQDECADGLLLHALDDPSEPVALAAANRAITI